MADGVALFGRLLATGPFAVEADCSSDSHEDRGADYVGRVQIQRQEGISGAGDYWPC